MYFMTLCHLGSLVLILFFTLVSDTLASRLVGIRISFIQSVELVDRDLTSKTQWIKHGCLKVNGVSRCSQSAEIFEVHPRWIELQHRAIFEAGFPPYKTPEATYPVCVQELTWPLLWEDVRFDLKTMCLSNDQGNRRHGTHQLCCTKPYAGVALTSPYFLNGKGGENPEGIVRDLDSHWLKTDEEGEDDEAEMKSPLKYDFKQSEHSFPTFRPLDSSLSNVFESEDQSLGGISSLEDSFETDTPGNGGQPQLGTFSVGSSRYRIR